MMSAEAPHVGRRRCRRHLCASRFVARRRPGADQTAAGGGVAAWRDDGVMTGLVGLMRDAIAAGFDGEPTRVVAAGIGVCGPVDDSGSLQPPLPSGFPGGRRVVEIVGATLGVPVAIDNDANMAALGELSHGAGRGFRDFVSDHARHQHRNGHRGRRPRFAWRARRRRRRRDDAGARASWPGRMRIRPPVRRRWTFRRASESGARRLRLGRRVGRRRGAGEGALRASGRCKREREASRGAATRPCRGGGRGLRRGASSIEPSKDGPTSSPIVWPSSIRRRSYCPEGSRGTSVPSSNGCNGGPLR